jgi:peptidase M23-like protein
MTQSGNIRTAVYFAAAVFILWPILMLSLCWMQPSRSAGFIVSAALLLFFLVISRWDIVGYWQQYVFLLALLILAWHKGGWLPVALSLVFLLAIEIFFRQSGRSAPLELPFPLNAGTYYIAHGGSFKILNHHRGSKSQSCALDIVQLNSFGMRAAGIYPQRLQQYKIFGDVVYSPSAGTVTSIVNGLPDLPLGEMDSKNVAGNHIVIRCDDSEVYVGLAHLMQGSALVKAGDRVTIGQALARVGNSGNTSEPHLHIHAKRGGKPESMLDGEGVPMRFSGRWLIRNSVIRNRTSRS